MESEVGSASIAAWQGISKAGEEIEPFSAREAADLDIPIAGGESSQSAMALREQESVMPFESGHNEKNDFDGQTKNRSLVAGVNPISTQVCGLLNQPSCKSRRDVHGGERSRDRWWQECRMDASANMTENEKRIKISSLCRI